MVDTHPEVMTIYEVSEYLRIPISSLYRLAQYGKIPCRKVGRHWRFRREAIERWLEVTSVSKESNLSSVDETKRQ